MRLTTGICFLLAVVFGFFPPEASAAGFLPVRNFGRDNYLGGPQNWSVVQDSVGRLYVGNRDGMMRYDGQRWHTFYLPNYTTVRSMMYDAQTGRMYAGGSEEFGYFSLDSLGGNFTYTTLIDKFRGARPSFSEVWNIFRRGERVYFQSDNHLFAYEGSDVVAYPSPGRISRSAVVSGKILLALDDGSLVRFNGTAYDRLPGTAVLSGKKIVGLLPMDAYGKVLVVTSVDGLYLYDGEKTVAVETDITPFLKENQVFCAVCDGNDYMFGTVNRGAVVKNIATGAVRYINKETGLNNNTVLGAYFDKTGNLWLALDNGLDYVLYNSPVSILVGPYNTVGAGYVSLRRGNVVYFGTNQGLYSTPYPFVSSPSPLALKKELRGQIWSVTEDSGTVFVGGDAGAFHSSGTGFTKIQDVPGTYKVVPLRDNPSLALASTYDRFHLLERQGGKWVSLGPVEGYDDIGGSFVEDEEGYIWLAHWRKGIYRLRFNSVTRRFEEKLLLDTAFGMPGVQNNNVSIYNGRVVFSTAGGFYDFDNAKRTLMPDKELNKVFDSRFLGTLTVLPDGSVATADNAGVEIAHLMPDGALKLDATSFKSMGDKLMPGFVNISSISPNELIVSNQDGFWSMNPRQGRRNSWTPQPFVNAVYANHDSLVYQAPPSEGKMSPLTLPYNLNALKFEFACPDFSAGNNIEFSSFLENYDNDWSPYTTESAREYTRLSEGEYILRLRARNTQTGYVGESTFTLTIQPPWFRTTMAKVLYTLLALLTVMACWFTLRRWLTETQKQMDQKKAKELDDIRKQAEQEALVKDYEIATLKSEQLEHDIRHKSQELSSTTMNLVRKNEILHDIATKISRIQEMPGLEGSALRHLAKIQTSIEENIRHDDDWKTINQNFDIVYENYTKRLMELHPNLSASDKRMCCYIKMGLSSKEIAPLVNISYKSVEMARYRLRKKMEIPADISLSDYLANL